jgi:LmbE family N-acetylglucosaminyl deacetylase
LAELGKIRSVLAVGAHPDDCELLCGGTLAAFAAQRIAVTICAVARGDKGSRVIPPEQFAAQRQAEATKAARVIGAKFVRLDAADGEVAATPELQGRLLEIIRRVRPDLILTHWPDDYHADHRETAELVIDCSWYAASPGHRTQSAALDEPVPVFYMDTLAGLSFEPTEYVDISGVWATKEELLRCHASQLGPTAQHGEGDLVSLARDLARFRGRQCGVEFAEGFRACLKWKRVRPYRMLP